jgi:hypothetical protein
VIAAPFVVKNAYQLSASRDTPAARTMKGKKEVHF